MNIAFKKYQGTGNDFIMLDNMDGRYNDLSRNEISALCDRKMGVGADGLIKISQDATSDFYVDYFNADGSQSFCANGARCSVALAQFLGLIKDQAIFNAIDGMHRAKIENGIVHLEMLPVNKIDRIGDDYFIHTGSPHYIHFKQKDDIDIVGFGKKVRYSDQFVDEGVNVNYLDDQSKTEIFVETYERGVEDETLSCGTGVTACGLLKISLHDDLTSVDVKTKGGNLSVSAKKNESGGFTDIWLSGPAKHVFDGSVEI